MPFAMSLYIIIPVSLAAELLSLNHSLVQPSHCFLMMFASERYNEAFMQSINSYLDLKAEVDNDEEEMELDEKGQQELSKQVLSSCTHYL